MYTRFVCLLKKKKHFENVALVLFHIKNATAFTISISKAYNNLKKPEHYAALYLLINESSARKKHSRKEKESSNYFIMILEK